MDILYLLALMLAFGAAFLAIRGLIPTPAQLYEMRRRAATRKEAQTIASPLLRLLWPLLTLLLPFVRRLGSPAYREARARDIPLAGLPRVMTVDHLLAMKVILAAGVPLVTHPYIGTLTNPIFFVLAAWLGWAMPDRLVREQKAARERKIIRGLPGAVDILTLSVEAGMDFLAALQRVMEKGATGPLREEVATIINDVRLGASRAEALRGFAQRIDVPEVTSFVGVLVQADRLGASIGDVLRTQADRMRTERFQRAEKAGAAASQKLLVPLAVFIFPAVMIVIVGPVVLQFMTQGFGF
ncbi:MAG: type II secretion system F family protein [Acidobacteriota bacterium]